MSLLNVCVRPKLATISVDTAAISAAGEARDAISKLVPLVHARMLIALRGDRVVLAQLFACHFLAHGPMDYDLSVDSMEGVVREIVNANHAQGSTLGDFGFVVVGWSPRQKQIAGRIYEVRENGESITSADLGSRVGPWNFSDQPPTPVGDGVLRNLASRQAAWLRSQGAAGGGELIVAEVTRDAITIRNLGAIR